MSNFYNKNYYKNIGKYDAKKKDEEYKKHTQEQVFKSVESNIEQLQRWWQSIKQTANNATNTISDSGNATLGMLGNALETIKTTDIKEILDGLFKGIKKVGFQDINIIGLVFLSLVVGSKGAPTVYEWKNFYRETIDGEFPEEFVNNAIKNIEAEDKIHPGYADQLFKQMQNIKLYNEQRNAIQASRNNYSPRKKNLRKRPKTSGKVSQEL